MNGRPLLVRTCSIVSINERLSSAASDALGGVLQPTSLLAQMQMSQPNEAAEERKKSNSALLTGDLETSLASLAQNLSINRTAQPTKYENRRFFGGNELRLCVS